MNRKRRRSDPSGRGRHDASVKTMRQLFERFTIKSTTKLRVHRGYSGRPVRPHVGILSSEVDNGFVLADALEERGYTKLAEALAKKLRAVKSRAPGWAVGTPFLLLRVEKALDELEHRQRPDIVRKRAALKRRRVEDPKLRASYDWFRAYGMNAQEAMRHARAEQFFFAHGWDFRIEPEQDRYQDVYGRSPENAEIERKYNFVYAEVVDSRGIQRDALGMVQDVPDELRYQRANLTLNAMGRRRA